jgi:hypothetical protein
MPLSEILCFTIPLVASALAWLLLFLALPPSLQNFPLNDDWAFAQGAFRFARGEGIDYSGWASMPQLGQWLWACPFLWLLGFSFSSLRIATIALSWVGLGSFYDLLRQSGVGRFQAALASGTFGFTPLFFLLQGTFMTDVPALSLALLALTLYVRAIGRESQGWFAAACVVAGLGAITRQNTVTVPVIAAVLVAWAPNLRRRIGCWLAASAPILICGLTQIWFQSRDDIRPLAPAVPPPSEVLLAPFVLVLFCALSGIPLLVGRPVERSWLPLSAPLVILLGAAGYWLLSPAYLPYGGLFPYTSNMLSPWGAFAGSASIGPLVMGERPLLLGIVGRTLLTLLGCIAGAVFVRRIGHYCRWKSLRDPILLFTLMQLVFVLVIPGFFDRYFLFLLPGALCIAARASPDVPSAAETREPWLPGLAALALLSLLSVGLMHDWLAWNAARWQLGSRAIHADEWGIDPLDIEGGFEWDAWHGGRGEPTDRAVERRWPVLPFTQRWLPQVRGKYALSFSVLSGTVPIDSEPYTLWLLPGRHEFYLIEFPSH